MKKVTLLLLACFLAFQIKVTGQTYPDVASIVKPNPEPAYPSGFDNFTPPVDTSSPAGGAPAVADYTKTGGPDESLVVLGENFGSNVRFIVYGQTGSGDATLADAKLQKLDTRKAAITLPSNSPAWSAYMLWEQNLSGYGRPVVVNKTEAWWVGPDKAAVGDTSAVFGRNLAHGNGTGTSYVYIKPAGGSGTWTTVTAVNRCQVKFTVPGLSNGTYEVWVHNGHGGKYGWSKSPNNLTIYSGPGWTGTEYNVKNYGATGNGSTDDTYAIRNAIAASAGSSKSTVYFPAGTYMITGTLKASGNQRWLGAGKPRPLSKHMGLLPIIQAVL